MELNKLAIVIPTYNAGNLWLQWLLMYSNQTVKPAVAIVVDSSSSDKTPELAANSGFSVINISKGEFDHGFSRQLGLKLANDVEFIVYATQDAIMADKNVIEKLLLPFSLADIGIVFGRQLPRKNADAIETHSRVYNYPAVASIKSYEDRQTFGIKTAQNSNAFAAYRNKTLVDIGGFPSKTIMGEDVLVAARALQKGWKIAYQPLAMVYHSHPYTILQEMKRYFDIGVFHAQNSWLLKDFGKAEGEGKRFLISEMLFLWEKEPWLIPEAFLRTIGKYVGYKLGTLEKKLPNAVKKKLSMNTTYWA